MGSLPTDVAPEGLVSRLNELAAEEAAVIRAERALIEAAPSGSPPTARWRVLRGSGPPRRFSLTVAAAVVFLAVAVTGVGLNAILTQRAGEGAKLASDTAAEQLGATAPAPESRANGYADTLPAETTTVAPPYVSLDGRVFALAEGVEPSSPMIVAGSVTTAFDTGDASAVYDAFYPPGDDSALVIFTPERTWTFRAVSRTFGFTGYDLTTGVAITSFGAWPTLPAGLNEPTAPDGSPTFRLYGKDDLGVTVYVPTIPFGKQGIAVPPGTAADDPAAGNPGWTWWAKAE
jgi:hypothetical protein